MSFAYRLIVTSGLGQYHQSLGGKVDVTASWDRKPVPGGKSGRAVTGRYAICRAISAN